MTYFIYLWFMVVPIIKEFIVSLVIDKFTINVSNNIHQWLTNLCKKLDSKYLWLYGLYHLCHKAVLL